MEFRTYKYLLIILSFFSVHLAFAAEDGSGRSAAQSPLDRFINRVNEVGMPANTADLPDDDEWDDPISDLRYQLEQDILMRDGRKKKLEEKERSLLRKQEILVHNGNEPKKLAKVDELLRILGEQLERIRQLNFSQLNQELMNSNRAVLLQIKAVYREHKHDFSTYSFNEKVDRLIDRNEESGASQSSNSLTESGSSTSTAQATSQTAPAAQEDLTELVRQRVLERRVASRQNLTLSTTLDEDDEEDSDDEENLNENVAAASSTSQPARISTERIQGVASIFRPKSADEVVAIRERALTAQQTTNTVAPNIDEPEAQQAGAESVVASAIPVVIPVAPPLPSAPQDSPLRVSVQENVDARPNTEQQVVSEVIADDNKENKPACPPPLPPRNGTNPTAPRAPRLTRRNTNRNGRRTSDDARPIPVLPLVNSGSVNTVVGRPLPPIPTVDSGNCFDNLDHAIAKLINLRGYDNNDENEVYPFVANLIGVRFKAHFDSGKRIDDSSAAVNLEVDDFERLCSGVKPGICKTYCLLLEKQSVDSYNPDEIFCKASIAPMLPAREEAASSWHQNCGHFLDENKMAIAGVAAAVATTTGAAVAYHKSSRVQNKVRSAVKFTQNKVFKPVTSTWQKLQNEDFTQADLLTLGGMAGLIYIGYKCNALAKFRDGMHFVAQKAAEHKLAAGITIGVGITGLAASKIYSIMQLREAEFAKAYTVFTSSLSKDDLMKIAGQIDDYEELLCEGYRNPGILQKNTKFFKLLSQEQKAKLGIAVLVSQK